jgi:hypothetical protein
VKAPARDQRLEQLRAFGLFIRGEHTLYQIAQALGHDFVERNPSTAAGRARTRVEQGWRVICQAKVRRWQRWWSGEFPAAAWQSLHGARIWTHPPAELPAAAPLKELTPFEQLLVKIEEAEAFARAGGFFHAAEGLRNLGAALRYNEAEPVPAGAPSRKRR